MEGRYKVTRAPGRPGFLLVDSEPSRHGIPGSGLFPRFYRSQKDAYDARDTLNAVPCSTLDAGPL